MPESTTLQAAKGILEEQLGVRLGNVPTEFIKALQVFSETEPKIVLYPDVYQKLLEQGRQYNPQTRYVTDLRTLCKKNLFFLAKYILGYSDLSDTPIEGFSVQSAHGDMCNAYVHKDDTKSIKEQDTVKQRLFLMPRGAFKSSVDMADCVQWIINFPDVRILLLSGDKSLAAGFLKEIKSRFILSDSDDVKLRYLFPEFCILEKDSDLKLEFTSPMRKKQIKEPTILASSIESTLSGKHFDVIKADDVVTNINSLTEAQNLKVRSNFYVNRKMLMPYGYLDIIGTRYSPFDFYGHILELKNDSIKCLVVPVWKLKDKKFDEIPEMERTEDMYHLLMPEYLSFKHLRQELQQDEESFYGQYLMEPVSKATALFDMPLLQKHTINFKLLPRSGYISNVWDFSFSSKRGRDASVGSVIIYDNKGIGYVVDLMHGRFSPDSLVTNIVTMARNWKPDIVGIENAGASHFLGQALKLEMERQNYLFTIDWFPVDTQKDAKRGRMAALYPMFKADRLYFSETLPHLQKLYEEFVTCMGAHNHDDIPDCIGHHLRYAPIIQRKIVAGESAANELDLEQANWNLLFLPNCDNHGRPGFGISQPVIEETSVEKPDLTACPPGLEPIFGSGMSG